MAHKTKVKGDLATTKVIMDLTEKGFDILVPMVAEHLPFDIVAHKENKLYRIQCKYSSNNAVCHKTSWTDKNGNHIRKYDIQDFDYYGVYLPKIDKIIYPNIKFGGIIIAVEAPKSATPFWWWEDFTSLTDNAIKRTHKDLGLNASDFFKKRKKANRKSSLRPSKEELEKLIWEEPASRLAEKFFVSDSCIVKWCKKYGIKKPGVGYWSKKQYPRKDSNFQPKD